MLSERTSATVRATLPAVAANLDEISSVFYTRLFTAHPDLLRNLFNRGNQANGTQRQALAGSIAAFASALVAQPATTPDALLSRIAHKHASLGITRDQYPLVHNHLFAAIAEVLGDAVTEEVAAAWTEVYWAMAEALIAVESRLYAEAGAPDGDSWREYRVVDRYAETDDVVTFVAQPTDGRPVPVAQPGQYVSVQVHLADGARQIRQYSLTTAQGETVRFAVKRALGEPAGEVSNHLHDHVVTGDLLRISAPFGDVVLDEGDNPVLLVSAGIGCTPMISMLGHLAATDSPRQVIAVHADRSERTHPLRADFDQLIAKLPNASAHVWYEEPTGPWPAERTGLVDLGTVAVPDGVTAYLCGPLPFMRAVHAQLRDLGVPTADIHYEVFGSDLWLARR